MNSNSPRYGVRSNGLNHGDVFTSPKIVQFMLDTIGYTPEINLSYFYILEPSFGHGDFLFEIYSRIVESSKKYNFNPQEVFQKRVFGCEIDSNKYDDCIVRLRTLMSDFSPCNLRNEDFLSSNWKHKFDFVVGNPPYVRYENIPTEARNIYKTKFKTFHYRCDLYVLFYEHSLYCLKSLGKHCFICSNRWLKNEYGKKLRHLICRNFNLEKLIDVEKLDAFQENVLAYPIISVISNSVNKNAIKVASIDKIEDLSSNTHYELKRYSQNEEFNLIFHKSQYSELPTIEEENFSIGIGVATGADRIFIAKDLKNKIEECLLLPIICAKDLSGNKFQYNGLYLLNPYDKTGNIIDINDYPKAKAYLEQYRTILQERHIVKNNRKWYALIDRVKTGLQHKTKILLPDISANSFIFIDEGNYYPSHNIYYITYNYEDNAQLFLLAAILMSDVIKEQLLSLSNKMNGGFPRWQSQVLRKLRIPPISEIDADIKKQLISAYKCFNLNEINQIVRQLFADSIAYVNPKKKTYTQLSLFGD